MQCPTCNVDLKISERKNIEIDYCPKCRGIWLDRGELDKLIEVTTNQEPRHSQRLDQDISNPYYKNNNHYYKKKSIWKEIFDF